MSTEAPATDSAVGSETNAMLTGADYLASLDDGREIWFDGERVKTIVKHPAFANAAKTIAGLYDALHSSDTADTLTTVDRFGNRTHRFFAPSYTAEELSLDPPFVDWWTLFGFNTGGGPCRAWCVGAGACRGSGWWVVGGLSTAGLSGVRQVLV